MRLAIVLAALALTGCSSLGLGAPDPIVYVAPTIDGALDRDSALHPENKPANDKARAVVDEKAQAPKMSPPAAADAISGIGALLTTIPGLTAVGAVVTGVGAVLHSILTRKQVGAVAGAVDQHAALIDSVTPEAADFAATAK